MFVHKLGKDTELRLLEERHAEELADLTDRNREHLRAWLPWVDSNRTVEDHRTFIRGALEQFAGNNGFQAGIWHEGRLAGVVGFYGVDRENRSAFLGYWLGEEFQGRGLVTAACRALVDHAPPGHSSASSMKTRCPAPSRTRSRERGTARARARALATGTRRSSEPWITRVGASMSRTLPEASTHGGHRVKPFGGDPRDVELLRAAEACGR